MATIACLGCGLPREDAEAVSIPCPVCRQDFPLELPPDLGPVSSFKDPTAGMAADVSELAARQEATAGSRLPIAFWFCSGIVVGILAFAGWREIADWSAASTRSKPGSSPEKPAPIAAVPKRLPVAPPPREFVARPSQPPPIAPNPAPIPTVPREVRLNNTGGTSTLYLRPGANIILRGHVKTLRIPALDDGAIVDATDLKVEEVVVFGKIDGGSRLSLKVPNGRITFLGGIDGKSRVDIEAPGGTVAFARSSNVKEASPIVGGGAIVNLTVKSIDLSAAITGSDTRVAVVLTAGGSMSFARVMDGARLQYRKSDPRDPELGIALGIVGGNAFFGGVD